MYSEIFTHTCFLIFLAPVAANQDEGDQGNKNNTNTNWDYWVFMEDWLDVGPEVIGLGWCTVEMSYHSIFLIRVDLLTFKKENIIKCHVTWSRYLDGCDWYSLSFWQSVHLSLKFVNVTIEPRSPWLTFPKLEVFQQDRFLNRFFKSTPPVKSSAWPNHEAELVIRYVVGIWRKVLVYQKVHESLVWFLMRETVQLTVIYTIWWHQVGLVGRDSSMLTNLLRHQL